MEQKFLNADKYNNFTEVIAGLENDYKFPTMIYSLKNPILIKYSELKNYINIDLYNYIVKYANYIDLSGFDQDYYYEDLLCDLERNTNLDTYNEKIIDQIPNNYSFTKEMLLKLKYPLYNTYIKLSRFTNLNNDYYAHYLNKINLTGYTSFNDLMQIIATNSEIENAKLKAMHQISHFLPNDYKTDYLYDFNIAITDNFQDLTRFTNLNKYKYASYYFSYLKNSIISLRQIEGVLSFVGDNADIINQIPTNYPFSNIIYKIPFTKSIATLNKFANINLYKYITNNISLFTYDIIKSHVTQLFNFAKTENGESERLALINNILSILPNDYKLPMDLKPPLSSYNTLLRFNTFPLHDYVLQNYKSYKNDIKYVLTVGDIAFTTGIVSADRTNQIETKSSSLIDYKYAIIQYPNNETSKIAVCLTSSNLDAIVTNFLKRNRNFGIYALVNSKFIDIANCKLFFHGMGCPRKILNNYNIEEIDKVVIALCN